jgi:acetylornithine deacetylase/succinyl-diaminopimelate desuccinylase-like protein
MGMGGSIPFIQMLGEMYPECVLLVTGVGGPDTNAHGPNENIDIKFTQKLIMSIIHILNQWNA